MKANEMLSLQGKKAVVTGAGHGIGRAYAEAMAECGADVVVLDLRVDLAQETVKYIQGLGRKAHAVQADMTNEQQVVHAMQEAVSFLGGLDIVFANVGGAAGGSVPPGGTFADSVLGPWKKTLDQNVIATMLTVREASKQMMRLGKTKEHPGKIICTASIFGLVSGDSLSSIDYNVAKGAVVNFIRSAGTELAKHGINVNGIAPGPIDNERIPIERLADVAARTAVGRHGTPDVLKGAAVLLASDAADYMVGHIIVVDGGLLAK